MLICSWSCCFKHYLQVALSGSFAGVLAIVRARSTFRQEGVPSEVDERVRALSEEVLIDGDEERRIAVRHRLARRLLDDPVVYVDELQGDALA